MESDRVRGKGKLGVMLWIGKVRVRSLRCNVRVRGKVRVRDKVWLGVMLGSEVSLGLGGRVRSKVRVSEKFRLGLA